MSKDKVDIMEREDALALERYGKPFISLSGALKQAIHNEILQDFGLRQAFRFRCPTCSNAYLETIEGDEVSKYLKLKAKSDSDFLPKLCSDCEQKAAQKKIDEDLLSAFNKKSKRS